MLTYSLRPGMHTFYVGPCAVNEIAHKLCKVGFDVYVGTEHLYVSIPSLSHASRDEVIDLIHRTCQTTFGLV